MMINDDKAFQEIGIVVMDALHHALDVKLVFWNDGQIKEVIGTIDQLDYEEKWMKVSTNDEEKFIPIHNVKSVERV